MELPAQTPASGDLPCSQKCLLRATQEHLIKDRIKHEWQITFPHFYTAFIEESTH